MENNERFLPIGSVVILKGGKRELMIMSYCVMPNGGEVYDKNGKVEDAPKLFDYGACFYPEGMVTSDQLFAFNHDQIEKILASFNNKYCCHGPFLSYMNGRLNQLFYMGGIYWIYPKKILQLFEKEYTEMINYIEIVKHHYDTVDDCHNKTNEDTINYFGELWFIYFMQRENMHSYQKSLINATTIEGNTMAYMTFDPYIMPFENVKDIFDKSFYNYMVSSCSYIQQTITYGEKENKD